MKVHYSRKNYDWETPPDFFSKLDKEFGFTLDVCATPGNAKCERYFSPEEDGLRHAWTGVCWMNPPYGRQIAQWIRKAYEEGQQGATVVCLVPARTDTAWWHEYAAKGEVRFVRGRLYFSRPGGQSGRAPFPCAVVVFGRPGGDAPASVIKELMAKALMFEARKKVLEELKTEIDELTVCFSNQYH